MTNAEFVKMDNNFIEACRAVMEIEKINPKFCKDFKPTTRQASKWRNKKGLAWKVANRRI